MTIIEIDKNKYNDYIISNKLNKNFLASSEWGDFLCTNNYSIPHYIALVDEQLKIQATTLLLENNKSNKNKYYYIPAGYNIDHNNIKIKEEITKKIIKYCKSNKGIFIDINSKIITKNINSKGKEIKVNTKYEEILNLLKQLKFRKKKRIKINYTYEINLSKEINYSKDYLSKIDICKEYEPSIEIGKYEDLDKLSNLNTITKDNIDYYKSLYKIFNKDKYTKCTLFLGKLYFDKTLKALNTKLKRNTDQISIIPIDHLTKSSKDRLDELKEKRKLITEQINTIKDLQKEYKEEILLNAHLLIEYGDVVSLVYVGINDKVNDTNINELAYYEIINHYKNKCQVLDLYNYIDEEQSKELNTNYIEYIGNYKYIINKPLYFLYKIIRKFRKD